MQSLENRLRLFVLFEARLTVPQLDLQLTEGVIGAPGFLLGISVKSVGAHDLLAKPQTLAEVFTRGLFVSGPETCFPEQEVDLGKIDLPIVGLAWICLDSLLAGEERLPPMNQCLRRVSDIQIERGQLDG